MSTNTSTRLHAARELRGFARRAGSPAAGPAVLDALHSVVPYDCAQLARWDPSRGQHISTAAVGYPRAALRLMETQMHTDPLFEPVYRDRIQLLRDIPEHHRCGEHFENVIGPLGFVDGLTQCLFAHDGRYLGMLNISTRDCCRPDTDAVDLLSLLTDELATVLDPLPTLSPATSALARGTADGLLITAGAIIPLSAGARPELVGPRSPLHAIVERARVGGKPPMSSLVVHDDNVFAVSFDGTADNIIVLHHRITTPFGLTARELLVLDAVSRGRTNAEIAVRLQIALSTVTTHVEHVLTKTGAGNRTGAARVAAELGLLF